MHRTILSVALAATTLAFAAQGQQPRLLANLNPVARNESSAPLGFLSAGPITYFTATGLSGRELYRTFGTAASTQLVADVWPGSQGSNPRQLTHAGNQLFFVADDGVSGSELWVTDGTSAGTQMTADVLPGSGSTQFAGFAPLGDDLVFVVGSQFSPGGLWYSDGTPGGTAPIPGAPPVGGIATVGGQVLLVSNENPAAVYSTDGQSVRKITTLPAAGQYGLPVLTAGNRMFFPFDDGQNGLELWATDGTATGTSMVANINPNGASLSNQLPRWIAAQDRVFFDADDGQNGVELWVTDGSPTGTTLAGSFAPGSASSFPRPVAALGRSAVVAVYDEIWITDGTASNAQLLASNALCRNGITVGSKVALRVGSSFIGERLWVTDGTAAGTQAVPNTPTTVASGEFGVDASRRNVLFSAASPTTGIELWISDFTGPGTHELLDLNPGADASSVPGPFVDLNGLTVFTAIDDGGVREPWATDGTAAGTRKLLAYPTGTTNPVTPVLPEMVRAGPYVYFAGPDGTTELMRTDGTAPGTVGVAEIRPGPQPGNLGSLTAFGNRLLFAAGDGVSGRELWISDGTAAGTKMVADLVPGGGSSQPDLITAVDGYALFAAVAPGVGYELWRTDGSVTTLVADLEPGLASPSIASMHRFGDQALFVAQGATMQDGLWISDGTSTGTRWLADAVDLIGQIDDLFYFTGRDAQAGTELWVTDGTAAGTKLAVDLRPGPESGTPIPTLGNVGGVAHQVGDRLFLYVNDDGNGWDLWVTDGTASGSQHLYDMPARGSLPNRIIGEQPIGSRQFMVSVFEVGGVREIVVSDGTSAGTKALLSEAPSFLPPKSSLFSLATGQVVFAHDDGIHGSEPWIWDPGATAQDQGGGCGARLRADDPVLGSQISVHGVAAANTAGVVMLSAVRPPVALSPQECMLAIDPFTMAPIATFNAPTGTFSAGLPIPSNAVLQGFPASLQAIVGPGTSGRSIDLSNAVRLTLGL